MDGIGQNCRIQMFNCSFEILKVSIDNSLKQRMRLAHALLNLV